MKRVLKGAEPAELRRWKEDNLNVPQNLTYGALGGAVNRAIRQRMILEQGYLCAYTMVRIDSIDDSHVEHIVPQSQQPISHERDIDYQNMLACYPGRAPDPRRFNVRYPYGARCKNGAPVDEANFVSPLQENVESRFTYAANGTVGADGNDIPALNSIKLLRLNHGILNDLRRAAIDERVFAEPLSAQDVAELADVAMMADSTGKLPEFCLAISQTAKWYANALSSFHRPNR
jgi:uncharacterized protein (TIGR02646 family)